MIQGQPNSFDSSSNDYPLEYLIGAQLFNRNDWFEAHDSWEELWHGPVGNDKDFYQGLIQVAVSLCHYFNGNRAGALRLYHSSRAYLRPYSPTHLGLDLERFLADMEACYRAILDRDGPTAMPVDLAPKIELTPAPVVWPEIPAWVYDQRGKPPEE